jgi:hypothetical protein
MCAQFGGEFLTQIIRCVRFSNIMGSAIQARPESGVNNFIYLKSEHLIINIGDERGPRSRSN